MTIKPKKIWDFVYEVFDKFIDDKGPKLGAALSFYTIFSLAPILIVSIAVAGFIFGKQAARGEIVYQIKDLIGQDGAEVIQTILKNASYSGDSVIAVIIGAVTFIIGSTIVFIEMQESLDMIWKVKPKPERNMWKGLIRDRLLSFSLVIGSGFLLMIMLAIDTIISAVKGFIVESFFNIPIFIIELSNIVISILIIFIMFMIIFKYLPDVKLEWRYVWVGALVTSILFVLGKYLIGLYLGQSNLSTTYGAAGSLVLFLLWVYYSAQIVYLGAEFTQVYANKFGEGIKPSSKYQKYGDTSNVIEH